MTILIAPDKFKGSLTVQEVCQAIREGIEEVNPAAEIICVPLADGGEGTCDLLTEFSKGTKVQVSVTGPAWKSIPSEFGLSSDGNTAFIEMAKASGLQLLQPEEKNPLLTTTLGTGQLIAAALDRKVKKIILGIGGSGTNDAGIGMAGALGYRFYSDAGEPIKPTGGNLIHISRIAEVEVHPRIKATDFAVIYDVRNPLYGEQGAAHVFARQKGASREDIGLLDRGLRHFAEVVRSQYGIAINFPGAGAGGGMSGGARLFLHATFEPGIDFLLKYTHLNEVVSKADLVITGEGKLDSQTFSGKVVQGVSALAGHFKKKLLVFTGKCELPPEALQQMHISELITLSEKGSREEDTMKNAFSILKQKTVLWMTKKL